MYYFDWTATTPMSQSALEEYVSCAQKYIGNPSSTHPLGSQAATRLVQERQKTAALLGTQASNIYFTSGGTESDSIILSSLLKTPTPGEIITTGIEHSAVLEWKKTLESAGWKVTVLSCPGGFLQPSTLAAALNDKVRMVCVMKVNNVTGSIQDTKAIAKIIREKEKEYGRHIHFHCDAVQALGKIPFNLAEEDFDSAAFSAHKFKGPRGVGILYNKNKAITALSRGGGQENGLRPGTENLAGICAMNKALEEALENLEEKNQRILLFRSKIEEMAKDIGIRVLSPDNSFSPYILCVSVKPVPSEVFLRVMSDKGFCLSAGSACSSNVKGKAEGVLAAMNVDPMDRRSSVRISFGADTTEEQVELLAQAIKEAYKEFGYGK
jgi:cysteine desulfurase